MSTELIVTSQVKVPSAFFAKSKLEYSNWRWAFFRELIQNSYDAGARKIQFQLKATAEGVVVIALDDGHGMTQEVLEGTLLCMGGSFKSEGAVGGFGYAKSLLFFAHSRYIIATHDKVVDGRGGDYTIRNASPSINGTMISVEMLGESVSKLEQELRTYVQYMRMPRPVCITLAGEVLKSNFEDFEYKIQTDIGNLLFKDVKGTRSDLVVAVGGLPMFVHQVWTHGVDAFHGMLYIEGSSFEMLTSNRDSLKGTYASALNRLVQRLIEERFSFKMGKTVDMTLNYTVPKVAGAEEMHLALEADLEERVRVAQDNEASFRFLTNDIFPYNFNIRVQNTIGRNFADAADNTISVTTVLKYLKKTWVQRLAVSWKLLVHEILKTKLMADAGVVFDAKAGGAGEFYYSGRRIATGFIFAKEFEGINIGTESDEILILCNPMVFDKEFVLADLNDLALHECTHLFAVGHHDKFNDIEMKLRRSLRVVMPEADLTQFVKEKVRAWKSSSIQY